MMHNMESITPQDAVIALAQAFYDRGANIQYDELSMDRSCKATPRRDLFAVPEDAVDANTVYLDCSSFVYAVYKQALGISLPKAISWEMAQLSQYRIFNYEVTHEESEQEKTDVLRRLQAALTPADILVYVHNTNGHVMLYAGDGLLYHCTPGTGGSYDYTRKKELRCADGCIQKMPLETLFHPVLCGKPNRRYLFSSHMRCFCILRPIGPDSSPTETTTIRMRAARGLTCGLTHEYAVSDGMQNMPAYKLTIQNRANAAAHVHAQFLEQEHSCTVEAGGSVLLAFDSTAHLLDGSCEPGYVYANVNGLPVRGLKAMLPTSLSSLQRKKIHMLISEFACGETGQGCEARLFSAYYEATGIALGFSSCADALNRLFLTVAPDVLLLNSYDISLYDSMVPAQYGGMCVVDANLIHSPLKRTKHFSIDRIEDGDILLYSDCSSLSYGTSCVFAGGRCLCINGESGEITVLSWPEADSLVQSMFGMRCFALLRPSQLRS